MTDTITKEQIMKREIDIESWNRKEHFEHFTKFEEPYFGIVTKIECANAYKVAKENQIPFFLYYLYNSLKAVNQVEEFKYRIEGDKVYCYDQIHASSTVARKDNTFGFTFIEYESSIEQFVENGKAEIKAVEDSSGLRFNENTSRIDAIHYSSIPWYSFSGLTHARSFAMRDSVPKISFGKFYKENEKLYLPVSVNVHHGLIDGYHLGIFLDSFQELMK